MSWHDDKCSQQVWVIGWQCGLHSITIAYMYGRTESSSIHTLRRVETLFHLMVFSCQSVEATWKNIETTPGKRPRRFILFQRRFILVAPLRYVFHAEKLHHPKESSRLTTMSCHSRPVRYCCSCGRLLRLRQNVQHVALGRQHGKPLTGGHCQDKDSLWWRSQR